ncbi:CDP-archaeol synthase [Candidatus Woesearchaeota archaeon]|nr:CDP-archaeol synthase [Candidatus Woesearchaeota archaeon]
MTVMQIILESMYFLVPAYFANMAPVLAQKARLLKQLDYPLDHKLKQRGKRLMGDHKTYRGLFIGVITGIFLAFVQQSLLNVSWFNSISVIDYSRPVLLGTLMGLGAMIGDAVASYFKRMLGIKPGDKWIPFDQLDFVAGALIFVAPLYYALFSWQFLFTALLASFMLHVTVNHLAFYLKIRKEKW